MGGDSLNQEWKKPKVKLEQIRKTADEINYRLRLAKVKPQDIESVNHKFSHLIFIASIPKYQCFKRVDFD